MADYKNPNILVIVLDSVRARNTSLHNYRRKTTPFLEDFADQATVYEQARSSSIWSLPSHVSMFIGEPPHIHGINTTDNSLQTGHSIWEKLATEFGYATGLFTSNVYLTEVPVGLNSIFETVAGRDEVVPYPNALTPGKLEGSGYRDFLRASLGNENTIKSLINGFAMKNKSKLSRWNVLDFLVSEDNCSAHSTNFKKWSENQSGPWAACINFMDAHLPYLPENEFNKWGDSELRDIQKSIDNPLDFPAGEQPWWKCEVLSNLYDGSILQIDNELKELVDYLKKTNQFENTHIIILGDHGEGFGEHCKIRPDVRYSAHAYGIDDSLLHVPLISKKPHQEAGDKISNLASLDCLYDVIYSTVNSESQDDDFKVNTLCVSSIARTGQLNKHIPGNSNYLGDSFAVYKDGANKIRKFVKWGENKAKVTFEKSARSQIDSITKEDHTIIDDMIGDPPINSAYMSSNESVGPNKEVVSRLEDLGYA